MLADFDLTGRRAVVTGAGRGIGKGIALALAEAGATVGVTSLTQANATRVAAELTRSGRPGFGWAADGTRVEPMQHLAERALNELGGLDILVNCIGDAIRGAVAPLPEQTQTQPEQTRTLSEQTLTQSQPQTQPPAQTQTHRTLTEQDWHTVIDINLTQAFVGCHVFGPHFLHQRHGCVINVSGFAAIRPAALMTAYAAAKAGVSRFTESLALEWAPHVRVNAIAPGTFPDPEQLTPAEWQRRQQQGAPGVPLGRFGQVREVGLLAVYLSSPAASYVTGQTIAIDGGRTLL